MSQKIEVELAKATCPRCHYVWTPRVAKPRQCPECGLRLYMKWDVRLREQGGMLLGK
jgi:predicted Zn-ribbon and HTH transcriptional regulator